MKKRTSRLLVILIFTTSFLSSLFIFYYLNVRSVKDTVSGYSDSIYLLTQKEGRLIFEMFFKSDVLFDKINQKEDPQLENLLSVLNKTYPYCLSIALINEKTFVQNYIIESNDNDLSIYFSIKSNNGIAIEDKCVKIGIDVETFFYEIGLYEHFKPSLSSRATTLVYGIKVEPIKPIFRIVHVIHGLISSLIISLLFLMINYKFNSYFYYSEGLEKIIYLFEKTEEYSANHSRNVAEVSYYIGKKYGLKRKRLKDLKVAAFLHDIGKISIPVEILNKDGLLSKDEFGVVKKHVIYSAEIIDNFESLKHLEEIILYHHEKMDGSGYPEGLIGDQIPLESRIIAVADIFEALVGQRPYRAPIDKNKAIEIMKYMPIDKEVFFILNNNVDEICELITYKKERMRKKALAI